MNHNEAFILPFLAKNRNNAGVIVKTREPDEVLEPSNTSDLEACAEDLCHAVDRKDYKGIAEAFKAMFQICELEPHAEDEYHISPHSYDSQNELAAKGND